FQLYHEFKVADVISLFQNRQHALAVRGISIKSEVNRAFSNHLIPVIAGQRDEAIVSFKNDAVGEAGNDEGVRACEEGFSETLLALSQRFVGPLAVGNVAGDREPKMLAMKLERLGRGSDTAHIGRVS